MILLHVTGNIHGPYIPFVGEKGIGHVRISSKTSVLLHCSLAILCVCVCVCV